MIVCTGQSSVAQRVRGLRLGADDWVTKPCHPEELIARIEAVVRRRKRADVRVEKGPVVIGEVEIRADQFQAFVGGASVELTRREFELIQLLAEAEGQVLQREEIYQRVWGYAMVHGDRSVDVFVRKLRSKLEQVSPSWRYIHTHFGIGYRFAAEPVEEPVGASTPVPEPVGARSPAAWPSRPRPTRSSSPRTRVEVRMGPDRNKHLRNIAIILALTVAVWKIPGGGTAVGDDLEHLLRRSSSRGMFFLGFRIYMEHRETIFGLEERQRGLMYGALALAAFALVATRRLWDQGGLGAMLWLAHARRRRLGALQRLARLQDVLGGGPPGRQPSGLIPRVFRHTFVTKRSRSVQRARQGSGPCRCPRPPPLNLVRRS